jgi:alpha-amylase
MLPVSVVLGSHCHIPDGLAETEYETAYNERLKPFLSTLYCYPGIPAVLHYSGPLLYWVERRRPEFFDLLREMLKRKQIEILSGGFYEPAMHLLAPQDRTGQIEMLSTYIRKHFGKRSTGAWIPDECWEQSVVTPLSNCAIAYTFLPERYFTAAGVRGAHLGRPVYTENQGTLIMVFPLLPIGRAGAGKEETTPPLNVENLWKLIEERGQHGSYAVFPERFSSKEKDTLADIHAFLESCIAPEREINWTLPSRLREEYGGSGNPPLQRLYFPGGEEKKFLTECPEANTIYAKMVFTRELVRQLRGDRERKTAALHEVYKAQCCNLYTSSARHSISDPTLRQTAYRSLLSAEMTVRETKKTVNALYSFDFDFDGRNEDIFRGKNLCFYTHKKGGHLFGIDYLPTRWNYIDSFHNYSFIETLYPCDKTPDKSSDKIFDKPFGAKELSGAEVRAKLEAADPKCVRRCGDEWWEETDSDHARQKLTLSLPKAPSGKAFEHIDIEKTYRLKQDTIVLTYTIHNRGAAEEQFLFCPEFHLAFAGYGEGQLRIFTKKGENRLPAAAHDSYSDAIDNIQFQDLYNETVLTFSTNKQFGALLGVNNRFDRYQSSSLLTIVPLSLKKGAKFSQEFSFSVTH